ncbi:MAG: GTP cyclohydrolase II [Campylobacterota bacterium]|nr:GTP cyclohydrolase II [Campylobacterota bacterium]
MIVSNVANLPTQYGNFQIKAYQDGMQEHLAIFSTNLPELQTPNVRIHSECLTGDALGSLKCDCHNQLHLALEYIKHHSGLVIYHRQEGRNIGLVNKVNAYHLQDQGYNTVEANEKLGFQADERDYRAVKYILDDLSIDTINIITNNPKKIEFLESNGITIAKRIEAITPINGYNQNYLQTKEEQLGHLLASS